jgi:hypothetical protein
MAASSRRILSRWTAVAVAGIGIGAGLPGVARAEVPAAPSATIGVPPAFAAFEEGEGRAVAAKLGCSSKHWRQIAPAVHHLAVQHAERLEALGDEDRRAALLGFARLIDAGRKTWGGVPVLAAGRTVIGLLDPAQGLGQREVTAIADAYGCDATIFKQASADQTLESVAKEFLAAVTAAVAAGRPTTLVVLGHGLPTEIQSYHIRFERLARALLDGAVAMRPVVPESGQAPAQAGSPSPASGQAVDLGRVVVICDDCFSADFHINLLGELEREAKARGLAVVSLPVCIAGTNRNSYGHAEVGETFVPHFWRDVIELYYVRKPQPEAVRLRDFFEKVDNMMYGYGRVPSVEDGKVAGYTLVDPSLVQDPVVFVPLDESAVATLRGLLRLPAEAVLPRWLDIG